MLVFCGGFLHLYSSVILVCNFLFFFFFFLRYVGLSLLRPLPPRSTGSGCAGSAAMAHGPSCSAQAPDAQAQWPWLTGPAALRHVGSPRTGARTRVPRIGRRTLNHCATREALSYLFDVGFTILILQIKNLMKLPHFTQLISGGAGMQTHSWS